MHNGIIKNTILNFIIYSSTLLWLLIYDFIKYFLNSYGINFKRDISIGITINLLSIIIIILSFVIIYVKLKKIKAIFFILYFFLSSYIFFPQNPYKWIYFSFGTIVFLILLNTFISLINLKKINELLCVWFLFISIFIIILIIILLFWKNVIHSYLLFLLQYLLIGYLVIFILTTIFLKVRNFCIIKGNKKVGND